MTPKPSPRVPVGAAPIPAEARSVLVFGGSFDPPHRAHIELPIAARDASGCDWLLYVPTARSPHKQTGPVASAADRIAMLEVALGATPRAAISTVEVEPVPEAADAPRYTVETLATLRGLLPGHVRLRLLIGADQAEAFHRWREPRTIIEEAEPLVMLRAGTAADADALRASLAAHWSPDETERWMSRIVRVPLIDAGATRIRALLMEGRVDDPLLHRTLHPEVRAYIHRHGLYKPAG